MLDCIVEESDPSTDITQSDGTRKKRRVEEQRLLRINSQRQTSAGPPGATRVDNAARGSVNGRSEQDFYRSHFEGVLEPQRADQLSKTASPVFEKSNHPVWLNFDWQVSQKGRILIVNITDDFQQTVAVTAAVSFFMFISKCGNILPWRCSLNLLRLKPLNMKYI